MHVLKKGAKHSFNCYELFHSNNMLQQCSTRISLVFQVGSTYQQASVICNFSTYMTYSRPHPSWPLSLISLWEGDDACFHHLVPINKPPTRQCMRIRIMWPNGTWLNQKLKRSFLVLTFTLSFIVGLYLWLNCTLPSYHMLTPWLPCHTRPCTNKLWRH